MSVSALCSVMSQKSSHLVCTWWFESIEVPSEKLLSDICPLHEPLSLLLKAIQWLELAFYPWKGKIPSSKCTLGREAISPSVTKGIPHLRLLCEPYALLLLPTLSLSLTLPLEKGFLTNVAPWVYSPPIHGSEPLMCHVLSLQLGDCFLNPQILFLVVQSSLTLI